ncbi:MAG: TetR family transcriptional regulator, partial [Actinobacteria bacterium]|nr:TetR family transcriptional regulator [Actinomycetota bacterium]
MVKVSRQRSAELRIELLDAAAAELRRVGYDAMALTTVAGNCGLATSAIYNRFPTKEALVDALLTERIEPELGAQTDTETVAFWSGSGEPPKLNFAQLGVVAELLLAARHTPSLHNSVYGFLHRRAATALAERNKAAARGDVRDDQDPRVQVLMRAATWIGSYFFSLVSEPPKRGEKTLNELTRMAVMNVPFSTPLPPQSPNKPRVMPKVRSVQDDANDNIHVALVDSAAEVFAELGYEAAAVADIARRAQLTTGAIYNRFSGKAGLMNEVILSKLADDAQIVGSDLVRAIASSTPISQPALKDLMSRLNDDTTVNNRGLRLAARDAARHESEVAAVVGPLQDATLSSMADFVRNAQGEGLIRSDIDPEVAVWFWSVNPVGAGLVG